MIATACSDDALMLWEQALDAYRRLGCFRVETVAGDPWTSEWLELDLDAGRFVLESRYTPEQGEPEGLCVCGDGKTVTAWDPYRPATYRMDTQSPRVCDAIQHQVCIVLAPEFRRDAYAVAARRTDNEGALVFDGYFVALLGSEPRVLAATWSEAADGGRTPGKTYRTVRIPGVRLVSPPAGSVLRNPAWTRLDAAAGDVSAPVPQLPSQMVTICGDPIRSEDLLGSPTLLEFWATWCGSCRERVHHLEELRQAYAGRVHVLGVNRDASSGEAAAFVRARGFGFPVVWDGGRRGGGLFADWHVEGVPTVYALDRQQRPVLRGHGMAWADIRRAVEELLA